MVSELVFGELVKQGYSRDSGKRVWNVSNHNLLFSLPQAAQGFLELKNFGVYRRNVIEREIGLIKSSVKSLKEFVGKEPFNLIDLFASDGERARVLLKGLGNVKARYCPVSSSSVLTNLAVSEMKKASLKSVIGYAPRNVGLSQFPEVAGMLRNSKFQRNVVLLLGSSLASFEINDFLFSLSKDFFAGDSLIIGNGIRTGKRLVHLEVYKSESFHRWFFHMMAALGFREDELKYDARFGNSRVECFYTLMKDKLLSFGDRNIMLRKGDEILVAVIYKYYAKELEKFCRMYFPNGEFLKDEGSEYSLILCKK